MTTPMTRRHNQSCPGCLDYHLILAREHQIRLEYYRAGLVSTDQLHDLRCGLVAHLKSRHPLRTEKLKQLGQQLGAHTGNETLLAALSQWEAVKDGEIHAAIAASVKEELAALRHRNNELETELAQHTERRGREHQSAIDRACTLREQLDRESRNRAQAEEDRRELSRAAVRLLDHITTRGHQPPTMPNPEEWYRQWAEQERPSARSGKARPAGTRWKPLLRHYQAQWGQPLLQRLWSGTEWTTEQVLGPSPAPRPRTLLQGLIEHRLIRLHDPDGAGLLTVEDELRGFADEVAATLGPRKPSPAVATLEAAATLPKSARQQWLRAVAAAGRDHHLTLPQRKPGALPLFRLRHRHHPDRQVRWLLPWLPGQEAALRELITRAHGRDPDTGPFIVGATPADEVDELLRAAGYDPQLAERLWLNEQRS